MLRRLSTALVLLAFAFSLSGCIFYPYHHDHYDGGGYGGGYNHGPGGGGYYQHP